MMKQSTDDKLRKIVIISMGVLLTVILYQFLWKPGSSPIAGDLGVVDKAQRVLAPGIWGQLGFYADPKDNIVTYVLIGFIVLSIAYRLVIKPYNRFVNKPLPKQKGKKTR